MAVLIHFVASWADRICAPHRLEAAAAAHELGVELREADVDDDRDLVRAYGVLNVPAVVIEGRPDTLLVGSAPCCGDRRPPTDRVGPTCRSRALGRQR